MEERIKALELEITELKSRYENLDKRLRFGSNSDWFRTGILFCAFIATVTRLFV